MINEDLTELRSFDIDLQSNEKLEIDSYEIKKLIDSGFKTVTIKIYGSSALASANLWHNTELFEKIKKIQSLPDNIVYDFFDCKGKLLK